MYIFIILYFLLENANSMMEYKSIENINQNQSDNINKDKSK